MMDDALHRALGAQLFNKAWDLIERADRSADDDIELLLSAMTSRWHWTQVGGPEEVATGDWQIAHVASLLGFGDLATVFAERNLAAAEGMNWSGWRLASAHEGMARASAARGEADRRRRHLEAARQALESEPDPGERAVIAAQIDSVPDV